MRSILSNRPSRSYPGDFSAVWRFFAQNACKYFCNTFNVIASHLDNQDSNPGKSSLFQKYSNSRKIARIAPISTIFGPNESSRRNLFLKNFRKKETNEINSKNSKAFRWKLLVHSFGKISGNRSRRDDSIGPKIVEIGAILGIFEPFEVLKI